MNITVGELKQRLITLGVTDDMNICHVDIYYGEFITVIHHKHDNSICVTSWPGPVDCYTTR